MYNKEEIVKIIKNSVDIINVKFIKNDGSVRSMNCRSKVKAYLTQNPNKSNKKQVIDTQYITVYDMVNKGYRKINVDTIISVKKYGVLYTLEK